MPLTNIFIIVFILAMVYMGTIQGTFSSFLHLLVVIAAGTLAFAVWEPLTLSLLLKYLPLMAWSIGLLIPFALLLLILRMTSDKLIPGNAKFPGIMNTLVGGGCGFLSGVLTAGIVVIGLGFLPLGSDFGGWRPYTIGASGEIQDTETKLWLPVHKYAAGFFNRLSGGAFASSTPMNRYMPHVDVQAALLRERPVNVSIVASPDAVDVTGAYVVEASALTDIDLELASIFGPALARPGTKLVIVETQWQKVQGTVDSDRALRIPSSHARLIATSTEPGSDGIELVGAVGFSKPLGDTRTFYAYSSDSVQAFSTGQESTIGFVYLLDADQEPLFAMMRKLRLELPETIESDPAKVLAALGTPPAPVEETDTDADAGSGGGATQVGDRDGQRAGSRAYGAQVSNKLPTTASKNSITGLSVTSSKEGATIDSGSDGTATKPPSSIGQNNRINAFTIPEHEAMVRLEIDNDSNQTTLGIGVSNAAAQNPIFLLDSRGEKYYPTAWVYYKDDKSMEIYYDAIQYIRSAANLPLRRMRDKETFYLYFTVVRPQPGQPPIEIVSYNIGNLTNQAFEPPLRVE